MDDDARPRRKARDNPWYKLATLHGEPSTRHDAIAIRNRITWNRWMAPVGGHSRTLLTDNGLAEEELTPFSAEELEAIASQVGIATGDCAADFSNTEFDAPFIAAGFIFGLADFRDAVFRSHVELQCIAIQVAWFAGAVFASRANFNRASFGYNSFSLADFQESAYFVHSKFAGATEFSGTVFRGDVNFSHAVFEGDNANFWGTDFRGKAVFYHAKFRHAEFIAAGFRCDANFLNTLFEWNASFEGSTFRTEALFVDTKFILSADFNSVTFISRASFEGAVFSAYAKFTRATFQGKADFSGSEMKGRTSFDGARFSAPPEYFNAKLYEGTSWYAVRWPDTPSDIDLALDFADAYARLKLEMDKLKKHEDELRFFALEQQCRRVADGFWKGLPIALYGALCGHGRYYMRPLAMLVVVVVLGAVPIRANFGGGWSVGAFTEHSIGGGALGLSFANTFGFLSIRKDLIASELLQGLPGWLKVIATIQTILGIVLLFLFGLSIRNRFRMK